jgi:hypothetical protein
VNRQPVPIHRLSPQHNQLPKGFVVLSTGVDGEVDVEVVD